MFVFFTQYEAPQVFFVLLPKIDSVYKHEGFDLTSKLKIHYHAEPRDVEVPYFLAQELIPGYLGDCEGVYCPPKGYFVADENPEAFKTYEATFPMKEKLRLLGQLE